MGWISVSEARRRLGGAVSLHFVYDLARRGTVDATQIGGRILIDEDSLNRLISLGRLNVLRSPAGRKRGRPKRLPA
jgi:excisionase family DNA binding protein